jgi:NDP-sugar pyrophosphorylase family protein
MLKIIVPMGGEGRRFVEQGYTFPKPLIEIDGRPMIELVVQNLCPDQPHEFIFICRQQHLEQYALNDVLKIVAPGCRVVSMRDATAGALCSVLLASNHLDGNQELLVANADQIVDVCIDSFLADARNRQADGSLVTFHSTHPKWSYVRLEDELVVAAAEKRPISTHATAGLYYFRRSDQFIAAAERMLLKNASLRSEFFVCPVYNEFVLTGMRVTTFEIDRHAMHSLGTPEDVKRYAALLEGPPSVPAALDARP